MMAMPPEEKARRARQRMLDTAAKYKPDTYARKYVAPKFQEMIRAEAGAQPDGYVFAVKDGMLREVFRQIGECVCVTCGKVLPWRSTGEAGGRLDAGHFLQSRRNSILFEALGVNPQCSACNGPGGGKQNEYRQWMETVRGKETIERLERLKTTSRQFTREELVDMRIEYMRRLKAAKERMR